jgi:hypothetical protein
MRRAVARLCLRQNLAEAKEEAERPQREKEAAEKEKDSQLF